MTSEALVDSALGLRLAGKGRGSITHCSFANLSVLRAIYSVQCKTRIQRTDSQAPLLYNQMHETDYRYTVTM